MKNFMNFLFKIYELYKTIKEHWLFKVIVFLIAVVIPFGVTALAVLNGKKIKEKLTKENGEEAES